MTVPKPKTWQDVLALGDDVHVELWDGVIVEKASPSFDHGAAQIGIGSALFGAFRGKGGGPPDRPGGWWIIPECDIELAHDRVVRPDLAGWRRECVPEMIRERPVRVRPDWVCEILSDSNARADLITKLAFYRDAQILNYWIADPTRGTLTVHRWTADGYLVVLAAARDQSVRPEPFDALEFGALLGDDP